MLGTPSPKAPIFVLILPLPNLHIPSHKICGFRLSIQISCPRSDILSNWFPSASFLPTMDAPLNTSSIASPLGLDPSPVDHSTSFIHLTSSETPSSITETPLPLNQTSVNRFASSDRLEHSTSTNNNPHKPPSTYLPTFLNSSSPTLPTNTHPITTRAKNNIHKPIQNLKLTDAITSNP